MKVHVAYHYRVMFEGRARVKQYRGRVKPSVRRQWVMVIVMAEDGERDGFLRARMFVLPRADLPKAGIPETHGNGGRRALP